MMRSKAGALLLALALWGPAAGHAEMPYPSNPTPCSETPDPDCIPASDFAQYLFLPVTTPLTLPNDYGTDNWKYTSEKTGDPVLDGSAQELYGVKGASVDRAWQTTTGRPDVVLAVLDSGIRWGERLPDLVNKFYLNRGELPPPQGSDNPTDPHDRNRDGFFTLPDYLADDSHAADTRVSDQNGNGMVDPEDLIFIFSDGVDQDGNGYVDDISGWDFFEDDNDPLDEVRYGHGTGESHDSGAEANNGGDAVGTCPNCLLLEVRVGDSFVTEVNHFAQGVVFAVDSGADVVQEALGTLNNSRFGQEAVDYAYRNGVVVIASAADEESNHHNYPANYNHTVQVNSVTRYADVAGIRQTPRSYLYLNGCTNYGAHIALSVPSSSCSSEATGRSAGMAGLVISAALNAIDRGMLTPYERDDGSSAPYPLSADEVKQILIQTADDINFDARDDVTPPLPQNYATNVPAPGVQGNQRFPSIAGFDQYFGYGRINADRAVLRVASGQIPPEAAIESPAWYDIVDPMAAATLTVTGRVAANRAASYEYMLEVAPGVQPPESAFQVVQQASSGQPIVGPLGMIDLAALAARMPRGTEGPPTMPDGSPDPDRFTFTVRLRVNDDQGNVAEDRRALALHHDPDLLAGFPRLLGGDGASAAATADLDRDGREEIVLGTSDGIVHAFRADGSELPGWPVTTDALELHAAAPGYSAGGPISTPIHSSILGSVAVGDLDRDGTLEVVATDLQGRLYVWQRDGSRRPGFPVKTLPDYSFTHRSERNIATPEGQVPDRTNRHDEHNRLGRALLGGAALGNLDGSSDGSLEIVAGAFDRHLYAWHHDGTAVEGWPVLLKDPAKVENVDRVTNEVTLIPGSGAALGTKIIVPPSLGDLDGDGDLEVVAHVNEEYVEPPNVVFENFLILLFQNTGILDSGNTRVYAVHHDGVAHGDSGQTQGWNPDAFVPGWPVKTALVTTELLPTVGTGSNGPPALADVDGDGRLEIGTMSAVGPAYVFDADGVSFFGRQAGGEDVALETEILGSQSGAVDAPTFGGLGAVSLVELAGAGQGFQLLGPAAGLGKLIDNQLPAQQIPAENHLAAWQITGPGGVLADRQFVEAFPRMLNDLQFLAGPAAADIDGDGLPEVLQGSGVYDLHGVDINGDEAPGWPKFTGGWVVQSPAVGDIDGDGQLEVIVSTREGRLFAWNTTGDECGFIPWRRWHHDEWGTGNYHADTRPPASLRPQDVLSVSTPGGLSVGLRLAAAPGDDLYCGDTNLDVRFAPTPIDSLAQYEAARPVFFVDGEGDGARRPLDITVGHPDFVGSTIYLGIVAVDEAGNRSELLSVGPITVSEPTTPTPTDTPSLPPTVTPTNTDRPPATATASATRTASSTVTETATAAPATPTAASTVTPTRTRGPVDSGCATAPAADATVGWWALLIPALVLLRRRF